MYVALSVAAKQDGVGVAKLITPLAMGLYHDRYAKIGPRWFFAERRYAPMINRAPD